MESACSNPTGAVRLARLLKIEGFSTIGDFKNHIKSTWSVDGYEWEIRIYVANLGLGSLRVYVVLELLFVSEPRVCTATLACRLVDPTGKLEPAEEKSIVYDPKRRAKKRTNRVWLVSTEELAASDYLRDDTFTVQCAITVLKKLPDPTMIGTEVTAPSDTLKQHLGELLQSGTGADVTLLVSGESFSAHKNILASRSSVFMAEFFGDMKEKCSQAVAIEDIEAEVFRALLHFIYTDTVPEFEKLEGEVMVMAQHLFAASDRYGLNRLKLICVGMLSDGISLDTVATTLALAEQHSCSQLKAKCLDFILRSPATLDAVLATDGYEHLESSCPLVVINLLKSARCRKI